MFISSGMHMFTLQSLYMGAVPTAVISTAIVIAIMVYQTITEKNKIAPASLHNIKDVVTGRIKLINPDKAIQDNISYCVEVIQLFINNTPGSEARISHIGFLKDGSPMIVNIDNKCITSDRHTIFIPFTCLDGSLTRNELKAILAHEFAHGELKHITKAYRIAHYMRAIATPVFLCQCANTQFFILYSLYSGTIDPNELMKITLLMSLSSAVSYATSAHSRKIEFEADKRSMRLSRNPKGLITGIDAIEKLDHKKFQSNVLYYTQSKELAYAVLRYQLFIQKILHSIIVIHPTTKERGNALSRLDIIDEIDNSSFKDPNNVRQRSDQESQGVLMPWPSGTSLYNNAVPGKGFTLFIPRNEEENFKRNQAMLRTAP